MNRRIRIDITSAACLALLPALVFPDIVFAGFGFFQRDLQRFAIPNASVFRQIVLSGEFPSWNPFVSGGQPLAANPNYGVFYPPNWLVLLPAFDLMFQLVLLLHLSIALTGMFAFLRSIGLGRPASVFGGITFGLSGLLLSYLNITNLLFAIAWVPLILLFGIRAIRRPNLRDGALAALALGLQVIVGEPTTIMQAVSALIAFGMYDTLSSRRGIAESSRRAAVTAAILLAGLCFGAVQFVPALDLLRDSERARGLQFEMVRSWSMPPVRPLELLAPEVFGRRQQGGALYWGSGNYTPPSAPYVFDLYIGLAALLLAIVGIVRRIRGSVPLLLLFIGSYLLAIGDHTPLLRWLYDDGLLRSIRYPEKFILSGLIAVIVLGALVLNEALGGDRRIIRAWIGLSGAAAGLFLLIALMTLLPGYPSWFARTWDLADAGRANALAKVSRVDFLISFLRSIAALSLGVALLKKGTSRSWYGAATAFLLFDLCLAPGRRVDRMPRAFFDEPALAGEIRGAGRGGRLVHLPSIAEGVFGERMPVAGNARYWAAREALFPRITARSGIATIYDGDYDLSNVQESRELFSAFVASWTLRGRGPSDFFYEIADVDAVLERTTAFRLRLTPRSAEKFYFANRIEEISGVEDFVKKTLAEKGGERAAFVAAAPFQPAAGDVRAVHETSSSARIEVRSEGRSLLVMSVTPHRYWRVKVDGRPVEPLVVNLGFQGVVLSANSGVVEMEYVNPLHRPALLLTALTLGAIIGSLFYSFRKTLVSSDASGGA